MSTLPKILIIAVGNDILGDDAVGLHAARLLRSRLDDGIDIAEASGTGFELIDLIEGYEFVLLIDSIVTEKSEPGTIYQFTCEDFQNCTSSSPHYVGIPELFQIAGELDIPSPEELIILAMEIEKSFVFREGLSKPVSKALPALVAQAEEIVRNWMKKQADKI